MSPDATRARAAAYQLLAELIGAGLSASTLDMARAVPGLAEHILTGPAALEALAVSHHRIFGFEVHPYAGVFLSEDGVVGAATQVERWCEAHKIKVGPGGDGPEHLGVQLALLAQLCSAQAAACDQGDVHTQAQARAAAGDLLQTVLLPWLAPLVVAVAAADKGLYGWATRLAWGLCLDHLAELGAPGVAPTLIDAAPPDLDDSQTDLRAISTFLCTPARCGLYLSRSSWMALARQVEVPAGFGARADMARELLLTASDHERFEAVLRALGVKVEGALAAYASLAAEAPLAAVCVEPWSSRARATLAFVEGLAERAADQVGGAIADPSDPPDPQRAEGGRL